METKTSTSTEKFQYQESAEKSKSYKIRDSKRKRLFQNENSTDDETDHVVKKVKIVKPPVNPQTIFKLYQGQEYEECLLTVEDALNECNTQNGDPLVTQYQIIQAACWTMLEVNDEKVKNQLLKIIANEPQNSFAHYGFGLYHYHQGNLGFAIEAFTTAIDLNPSGAMKKALELKAKAKNFMDMLSDGKFVANFHYFFLLLTFTTFLVTLQYEKNSCARAVDMLNAALSIDPENRKMTATIFSLRNSFVKDLVLRLEAEIEQDFPDKFRDAEKLMITNQMVKAEKLVNEINVEEPGSARAFHIRGVYLYLSGSLKEAHKLFVKALSINPRMEKAIKMEIKSKALCKLYEAASQEMTEKKYSEAIEKFTNVIELDPDNKFINQASLFQRALANFNIGEFDQAFEDYKAFESIKKFIGNVLKDIEVPDTVRTGRHSENNQKNDKEAKSKNQDENSRKAPEKSTILKNFKDDDLQNLEENKKASPEESQKDIKEDSETKSEAPTKT